MLDWLTGGWPSTRKAADGSLPGWMSRLTPRSTQGLLLLLPPLLLLPFLPLPSPPPPFAAAAAAADEPTAPQAVLASPPLLAVPCQGS